MKTGHIVSQTSIINKLMGNFEKFREKRNQGGTRDRGPVVLHRAICARCGNPCEVPFRPIGGRPIYCHNCFQPQGNSGDNRDNDRFPQRDFSGNNRSLKEQVELLNEKMNRLIKAVEAMANIKLPVPECEAREDVETPPSGKSGKFKRSIKKVFKKNIRPF